MNNCPNNANDLVLRLDGGDRSGSIVAINSRKCVLGFERAFDVSPARCAIFRGQAGAAIRTFGSQVLVNGNSSSVHWLQEGDRIEFSDSISAVVEQLGVIEQAFERLIEADSPIEESYQTAPPTSVPSVEQIIADSFNETPATVEPLKPMGSSFDTDQPAVAEEVVYAPIAGTPASEEVILSPAEAIASSPQEPVFQPTPALESLAAEPHRVSEEAHAPVTTAAELIQEATVETPTLVSQPNVEEPAPLTPQQMIANAFAALRETESPSQSEASRSIEADVVDDTPEIAPASSTTSIEQLQSSEFDQSVTSEVEEVIVGYDASQPEEASAIPEVAAEVNSPAYILESLMGDHAERANHGTTNETIGESINNLTHSSLIDGSSFVVEDPTETESTYEAEASTQEVEAESDSPASSGPKNESVSELLERMKAEGQWNGIDDEDCETEAPVEIPPTPEPQPAAQCSEEDEDVESYMSRLLSRMRGDKEQPRVAQSSKVAKPQAPVVKAPPAPKAPTLNPLKPEEFVPKQKAAPIESLGAMRALANSTARNAVQKSERSRRKALGVLQVAIGVVSFFMSLYYVIFDSSRIGDMSFCIGVVCIIIAGFLAFRFYTTMLHNEQVDAEEAAIAKAELAKKTATTPAPVAE